MAYDSSLARRRAEASRWDSTLHLSTLGVLLNYVGLNSSLRLLNSITSAYGLRFSRSLFPRVGEIMLYNFHLDSVG